MYEARTSVSPHGPAARAQIQSANLHRGLCLGAPIKPSAEPKPHTQPRLVNPARAFIFKSNLRPQKIKNSGGLLGKPGFSCGLALQQRLSRSQDPVSEGPWSCRGVGVEGRRSPADYWLFSDPQFPKALTHLLEKSSGPNFCNQPWSGRAFFFSALGQNVMGISPLIRRCIYHWAQYNSRPGCLVPSRLSGRCVGMPM